MPHATRIYFDNAATSWPKPDAVYRAMDAYQRELGCAAGRSGYAGAVEVDRRVQSARKAVARVLGLGDPDRLVFGGNGTDALNLALHGWLRAGDQVVTSVVEHNSVLRPLAWLATHRQVKVAYAGCDKYGRVSVDEVRRAVTGQTRLIAVTHVSNVTGAIQPVEDILEMAHQQGVPVLLDAAQSVGHVPLDLTSLPVDLLAFSGHKGLLGPLGTGVLYVAPGLEERLVPVRQGGTGTDSEAETPPSGLPERYEAGNLNVPGILGVGAAAQVYLEDGASVRQRADDLTGHLLAGLAEIGGLRVVGPCAGDNRTGVVSFQMDGYEPHEIASIVDTVAAVEVRAGLHCAPRLHAALGTLADGGTVRVSLGRFNTSTEIDTLLDVLRGMADTGVSR